MSINSKRKFHILFIDNDTVHHSIESLEMIISNQSEMEYRFAIQENIDKILDLPVGKHLYISFNRDHETPGLIKRIE